MQLPDVAQSRYRFTLARTRHGTLTLSIVPFILLQLSFLLVFTTHFSWTALAVCAATYVARMFFITAFYHRYFSHRTFRMGRIMQALAAFLGATAVQKGALWWAAHHRQHHKSSDTAADPHNSHEGFLHSHWVWFLYEEGDEISYDGIGDLTRHPELVWLDRHCQIAPLVLAGGLFAVGGWHLLVWGFFVSTVLVQNGTFCINSLMHYWGRQYYRTGDESRNHWLLALITLGEGWHNNHHRYQASARNGFRWYEYDPTYSVLWLLAGLGLVRDLKPVPPKVLEEGQYNRLLMREARRMGRELKPVQMLRGELQELGDQVAARARVLCLEIGVLGEQIGGRAGQLRVEMQSLQEQVGERVRHLGREAQTLGGQMASNVASGHRSAQREIAALQRQVAQRVQQVREEVQALSDQTRERVGRLVRDVQELGDLAARKGREVNVRALQEQALAAGRTVGQELQGLSELVGERARVLGAQLESLAGSAPGAA